MFTRNTIGGLLVVARVEVSLFPPMVHVSDNDMHDLERIINKKDNSEEKWLRLISRIFNVNPLI